MKLIHSVLYHGTRYASQILSDNTIRLPPSGYTMISLTRSPVIAQYWAELERDGDEQRGAILVLDRDKLRTRYRLEPFHDPWCDDAAFIKDEMEEMIWGRPIVNLRRYLLEVRWLSACSPQAA